MSTCTEDSGSMTDCRPICTATATHKVTHRPIGSSVTFTYYLCKRHAENAGARHYPDRVTVVRTCRKAEVSA